MNYRSKCVLCQDELANYLNEDIRVMHHCYNHSCQMMIKVNRSGDVISFFHPDIAKALSEMLKLRK